MAPKANPLYAQLILETGRTPMRKALLIIPLALVATLAPSISSAEVPTCFGQPATIVAQPGGEDGAYVSGTSGPDVIVGSETHDRLYGLGGDDLICGNGGSDELVPGRGNDKVKGGDEGDGFNLFLGGAGRDPGDDLLLGGPGDDLFYASTGDDTLDGGSGYDRITYTQNDAPAPVTVNLATGKASGWGAQTVTHLETVYGTQQFGDTLIGDDGPNVLEGEDGNDTLIGNGGDDFLFDGPKGDDIMEGGPGDDMFTGGGGVDTLRGGEGIDSLRYIYGGPGHYVDLGKGKAIGWRGTTDSLDGLENVTGGWNDDVLIGNARPNILQGSPAITVSGGDDTLFGRGGDDWLIGTDYGPGDSLDGGRGRDICNADEGDEILSCIPQPLETSSSGHLIVPLPEHLG